MLRKYIPYLAFALLIPLGTVSAQDYGFCGNIDCDDSDPCTVDQCEGLSCLHFSVANADLNGDGEYDALDLAVVLGAWGDTDSPHDINGDGTVNAQDLALVLGAIETIRDGQCELEEDVEFTTNPNSNSLTTNPHRFTTYQ